MKTTKFETGKTYQANSICDCNCIWNVKIIRRTVKFITFQVDGEGIKRAGISVIEGVEKCLFLGSYLMAPMISADR